MAEIALCRYPCPDCSNQLEVEGYILLEASDEELAARLLKDDINNTTCPQCGSPSRLTIPLIYHDHDQEFLIIYVPNLSQLSQENLGQVIRYPYGILIINEAARRGIELPEPDYSIYTPEQAEELRQQPGASFHALTVEQATALIPDYLLRPTIVDNFDILRTAAQAAHDGMSGLEVAEDMARLQLINSIMNAPDPLARRKALTHAGPYLNDELFEVIDTLSDQMRIDGQAALVTKLQEVKGHIERYQNSQLQRLQKKETGKETRD